MKPKNIAALLFLALVIAPAVLTCIDNMVQGRQNVNYSMSIRK